MEKLKLLLCLIGIHDWEYGCTSDWGLIKKQQPYHQERRCERCGKYQVRYPLIPDWDGPLGNWENP